jgi:hypothetical protein
LKGKQMLKMLNYANRTIAVLYVLGWLAWATSRIGEPPSSEPITWWASWNFALVLLVAMWLGWQARREAEHESR